ncbi:MAG: DegV family protein [Firmicutes bacterium]|nr:DegV family protein [Bacillota bacterium]
MSVRIIIDSSTDVNPAIESRFTVLPILIRFGEEEFVDGVTLSHQQFYRRLMTSDVLPTTSLITPSTFAEAFEAVAQAGDTAVVLTLASTLSGTYQSAVIAAQDYPGQIFVVDSMNATTGAGVLAEYALELADQGVPAEQIAQALTQERDRITLVATLDTLEYLKKGGRISSAVAFVGGMLSIKPVVCLKNGEVQILAKARGVKQGSQRMIEEIQKVGIDFSRPVLLGYTGLTDARLQSFIQDSSALWSQGGEPVHSTLVGSVVGTHVGPDAYVATFFRKEPNK